MQTTPLLDADRRREHKARNQLQSALLVGGLGLVTAFSAWLLWSWTGVLVALLWIAALYVFAPRLPPEMIMRMYRARPIDPRQGEQILYIVEVLSRRAKLPATPSVYVIPSMTLNAFATGTPDNAVIGITEGLLRRLSLRELAGVLAHEISHVRNNDLSVMSLGRRDDPLHPGPLLPGAVPGDLQPAGVAAGRFRHVVRWHCCCSTWRRPSAACCSSGSRARASTTPISKPPS